MLLDSAAIDLDNCIFEQIGELRLPLVNRFYSNCNYNVKCGRLDKVYGLSLDGKIIAAVRLIYQQSGCYLLRNLCVDPLLRNQGVASFLLRAMLACLDKIGCYCFSLPHLQSFYLSLDFQCVSPEQVPEDIAEMHLRHCARKRGWILMGYVKH
jgi:N-acetylglutamate synthase-like GNAT family acetyltransferase